MHKFMGGIVGVSGIILGMLLAGPSATAGTIVVCNSPATGMCGEYDLNNAQTAEQYMQQCQSMGSQASYGGQCDQSGAACQHSSGIGSVITYVYNLDPSVVHESCRQNGGTPL
ncbi:hypothetical protein [Curvivirga aplysinae]|uniref:hypothetical protein n=1 Tax=Curvivirga aplysinae TaxID=2529852 RepID=UPI0012BC4331|nr:hypothetical protein [Curvivirga aplysinae]MTI10333.1 hypothetical protein [Curvivirga aplysinae]